MCFYIKITQTLLGRFNYSIIIKNLSYQLVTEAISFNIFFISRGRRRELVINIDIALSYGKIIICLIMILIWIRSRIVNINKNYQLL